jgi:hypothetical protein
MQAYDELVERLAHLPRVSAREKGAATRMRPGERSSPGTQTWHRLYSPAQDTPPADAQALLPPFRPWPLSPLVRRLSKTALGLGDPGGPRLRAASESAANLELRGRGQCPHDNSAGADRREVEAGPNPLDFGTSLERGDVLFRIINSRADRSHVDN